MSRAERRTVPPAPRLWGTVKAAGVDLYYNSWRFVAGNIIFGVILLAIVFVSAVTPLAAALGILLVLPAAGLMRMATQLVRERHVLFSEFSEPLRRRPWRVLALGAAQMIVALVLIVDLLVGAAMESPFGTFLSVSAIYGLVVLWAYAAVAWPILLDPVRDGEPLSGRLRLAGLLLLAHPVRVGAAALLVGLVVLVSTLAIAAIVTFALGLAWLIAAHYVLPAADRFERRATLEIED